MAKGRIPESDIAAIRERTPIEDIVGEYVQLKPAGVDSLKGLSPFKDEKTPSFHVRPNRGYFHCFSSGEGGDVFSFFDENGAYFLPRGGGDLRREDWLPH